MSQGRREGKEGQNDSKGVKTSQNIDSAAPTALSAPQPAPQRPHGRPEPARARPKPPEAARARPRPLARRFRLQPRPAPLARTQNGRRRGPLPSLGIAPDSKMVGGGGPVAATLAAQPGRRSLIGRATPRPLLPAAPIGHTASQRCSDWLPRRRSRSARSGAIFQAAAAAGEGRGAEERSGGARPGPAPRSARRLRDMAGTRRGAQHRGTWGRDRDRDTIGDGIGAAAPGSRRCWEPSGGAARGGAAGTAPCCGSLRLSPGALGTARPSRGHPAPCTGVQPLAVPCRPRGEERGASRPVRAVWLPVNARLSPRKLQQLQGCSWWGCCGGFLQEGVFRVNVVQGSCLHGGAMNGKGYLRLCCCSLM